jgi:hypothetical protein
MTEAEWLACEDPMPMLRFLQVTVSERKLRLYIVGGCRIVWDRYRDERSKQAIEAGELYADGLLDTASLDAALRNAGKALDAVRRPLRKSRSSVTQRPKAIPALVCARLPAWPYPAEQVLATLNDSVRELRDGDTSAILMLVRELFGNPFRPATFSPSWRTDTSIALARQMYESRDFSAMPILADALQDAGCDNDDILNHCRGGGPHVRGCWVVDLVLGNE